jgi:hypothetical protein
MGDSFASSVWRATAAACVLLLALCLTGCGDDGSDPGDSGGGSGSGGASGSGAAGAGDTPCGVSRCEAGQHCNNGLCVDGCLSDSNCASNQRCEDIDDLSHIGTCRNVATAPAKDCQTFCAKAAACMDPEAALCEQKCAGLSSECVACVNDSNCGAGCDAVCAL